MKNQINGLLSNFTLNTTSGGKMITLYEKNGLVFWTEKMIQIREAMASWFVSTVAENLKRQNKAFETVRIEAPILTPRIYINPMYTSEDVYTIDDLALRPETTMGSYEYAKFLLRTRENKLPICVWQLGKSFRKEQDQPLSKMRLKEFYQLEFQCIYGLTTMNDYSKSLIPTVKSMIEKFLGNCEIVDSDRLPDYAEWTKDVMFEDMEVCSMSLRKDFPNAKVFEIAIGIDRCVACFAR